MPTLSSAAARRLAISAQRLDQPRQADILEVVNHLGALQLDPTVR